MAKHRAVLNVELDLAGALLLRRALDREGRVLGQHPDQNTLRVLIAELDRIIAFLGPAPAGAEGNGRG